MRQLRQVVGDDQLLGTAAKPFASPEIIGDISGDGLGLLSSGLRLSEAEALSHLIKFALRRASFA